MFRYSKRAGGDITAMRAQQIADMRERRHQQTYDRVLRRCLEQIRDECQQKPATIFVVPSAQSLEVMPYFLDNCVNYLIVALRRDHHFQVIRVNRHSLYIRWLPLDRELRAVERRIAEEAAKASPQPPQLLLSPPPPQTQRPKTMSVTVDLASEMADIERAMGRL